MTTSAPIPSDRTNTGPIPTIGPASRRMSTLSAVSLALALAAAVMTIYTTAAGSIVDPLNAELLFAPVFFTVGLLATVLGLAVVATVLGVIGGIDAVRAKLAGASVGWAGAIIGVLVAGFLLVNLIRTIS